MRMRPLYAAVLLCTGAFGTGLVIGVLLISNSHAKAAPAPGLPTYYRTCAAAVAAGVAPIPVGRPGYRAALDGNADGVACEPYQGR